MRNRTMWLVGMLGVVVMLGVAGCSGDTSGGGDVQATVSSLSGSVTDYPYPGVSNVQAFAQDGALLASGLLYPEPSSRVEGDLTAVDNLPSTAFVNPFLCDNATVSPASMRTTFVGGLEVSDSGGMRGDLMRATTSAYVGPLSVGDRVYFYFVATTSGRVSGNCVLDGVNLTNDVDLVRGWNHVSARVDAVDSLGQVAAVTFSDDAPGAGAIWYFYDWTSLSASTDSAEATPPVVEAFKRVFPAF